MPVWKAKAATNPTMQAGFHIERTYGTLPLTLQSGSTKVAEFPDITCAYSADVDLNSYDAFIVFGMHYSLTALAKTHAKYRSAENKGNNGAYLLSKPAYSAMTDELFQFSKAKRVIDAVRKNSNLPVFYAQQPMPLEWIIGRQDRNLGFFKSIVDSDDIDQLLDTYGVMLNRLEDEGVRVLRQPPQTLAEPGFTKSHYGMADVEDQTPESPYTKGDYFHMNSHYGELVTQDILNELKIGMGE
ncbi:hypothetical protein LN996_15390 [Arthrobacter sp. AK01]|uniref:hypothetical protein n=1 Tax=Arthrobacter sp. AK01 TaxID=2894084 RepID=UPI001E48F643|nr:hypothetical protein [Arthrobacter sp. AK01]MCD4852200.1 hypothetical protein [Arthrobacter sp. AK01]